MSLVGTTAEIGANGMLVTQGGRFSGWGLYLREGRPVFTMNCSTPSG
jgi:hypothetical protein